MKWNMAKYLLTFSALGLFSYALIVGYPDFSQRIEGIVYSQAVLLYTIVAFNLLGGASLMLSEWLHRRYILRHLGKYRLMLLYVSMASLFLLINYSLLAVAKWLAGVWPVYSFSKSGWLLLLIVWITEMAVMGLLLSNRTLRVNEELRKEKTDWQMAHAQARYVALQNQLNPHFLFNCLNTLIAEIKYNPDNAVVFTQHLSKVYRYVLQYQDKQMVPLREELNFAEAYLFLHRVRLGDCIECVCQLPEGFENRCLPPLTLQLLLENVLKHNAVSLSRRMTVTVGKEGDRVVVKNPVRPKKKKENGTAIGLKNLSARCRMLTGKEAVIEQNEFFFTVKIPTVG